MQDQQPGNSDQQKPQDAPANVVRPISTPQNQNVARAQPQIKFPPVMTRLWNFLFRPESWAEALRFPLRYAILPLIVAIIFSAAATAIGTGVRNNQYSRNFAANYDKYYPAMKYENGTLEVIPGANDKRNIEINIEGLVILIDPSGKMHGTDLGDMAGFVVGSTSVERRNWGASSQATPLTETWPFADWKSPTIVNGEFVRGFVEQQGSKLSVLLSSIFFIVVIIRDCLWSVAMILTVAPILILASGARQMRLQIAWRGATAAATPLIFLGGIFGALGYTPAKSIMPQFIMPFWFFAMLALAIWTGRIAARMYAPAKPRRGQ